MNGKQLKNSILQWAIQGKLVPQDPNDEPASVLLERIREEKARLVKEKKIKKDKNESIIFRGDDNSHYEKFADGAVKCIDDEIPFEIPQSWCWARFGTIMINRDFERIPLSVSQRQNLDKIYDYYGASGVIDKVDKYLFDKDLLLIGEDGANLINRSTPIAFVASGKYWVNNHAHVLDVCGGMRLYYIALFINAISLVDYVTGTAQPKMNQEKMNSILVAVPPKDEQTRIINRFSIIEPLVNKYDLKTKSLEQLNSSIFINLKKSVLQEAIQGRLVPQDPNDESASVLLERIKEEKAKLFKEGKLKKKDLVDSVIFKGDDNKYYEKVGSEINCIDDEIPFEIPSNWQWVRLGKVTIVNPRNTISDEMSVGFIPMTNISPGYGNSIECEQRYWKDVKSGFTHIAEGDVAFAKITPCFQNRKSFIAANLPNGFAAGTTELNVLRPYDNTIDTRYLLWFLKSEYFISEAKFKGTAGQQRVVTDYVLNRLFPLPPVKEQIRISNHLEFVIASIMRR